MKRTVEATKKTKKDARLLRSKARTAQAVEGRGTDPDGLPPTPVFPATRGLRSGALLGLFADSAVATRAAA